eukprot:GHVL01014267.1.p2 GENE.GHVL01014267.1~~GHVL01014267.1.p2  ORF type:complete len:122 (+),score=46.17 GHVL01014267.1:323-688(+)
MNNPPFIFFNKFSNIFHQTNKAILSVCINIILKFNSIIFITTNIQKNIKYIEKNIKYIDKNIKYIEKNIKYIEENNIYPDGVKLNIRYVNKEQFQERFQIPNMFKNQEIKYILLYNQSHVS